MATPRLIIFDLDGTLAESKQPLTPEMAELVTKLLNKTKVAVVSGGALSQFLKQVVAQLPIEAKIENLYLLPTSGAALYEWRNDGWDKIYEERLSETDKDLIEAAMRASGEATELFDPAEEVWGERIEYRGGQVSLSVLGQEAPIAEKKAWDPDKSKRHALQSAIAELLPKFTVAMGGSTTIDVTKKGVDKAYGIHQLSHRLKIPEKKMLYVGDELVAGGNDEAAFKTEVQTQPVANPFETTAFIKKLLK